MRDQGEVPPTIKWYNKHNAAELIQKSVRAVEAYVARGKLKPYYDAYNQWIFRHEDLVEFMRITPKRKAVVKNGGSGWDRTTDVCVMNAAL